MRDMVKRLYRNDKLRYVFFGGCTTGVNLALFYVLRRLGAGLNQANLTSIFAAILFAYVVNSRFVFEDQSHGAGQHLKTFLKFVGARLSTMAVEVGGVYLLVDKLSVADMAGKAVIQVLVLILNYLFSKFLVFTRRDLPSDKGQG